MTRGSTWHIAVHLDGSGTDPTAWREPDARPERIFTTAHLADLVALAAAAAFDFAIVDDALAPPSTSESDVRGRIDATLAVAAVAPLTDGIGLVPTVTTTHTEPFHVSKAIATIDLVSGGRAGWRVATSATPEEAAHFGRKAVAPPAELLAEAGEAIEVARRLWDSWEDDAVIRDVPTGRYIDRDKLHYIDFEGAFFSVRGPSIVPRSPQGQPLVVIDVPDTTAVELAIGHADVAVVPSLGDDTQLARALRAAAARAGRVDPLIVLGTLDVRFGGDAAPNDVVDRLETIAARDELDGFVLRPARLPHDLRVLVHDVAPILVDRGRLRERYESSTLRGHFGLDRPANRYAGNP
jgi:alkanesulfonate monooxygenase SsuD/methylene tetrahydromethanopterin reductase-like flavin-dependent oxidoreductase (luciferase family)